MSDQPLVSPLVVTGGYGSGDAQPVGREQQSSSVTTVTTLNNKTPTGDRDTYIRAYIAYVPPRVVTVVTAGNPVADQGDTLKTSTPWSGDRGGDSGDGSCPGDLLERAALLEFAGGLDRATAATVALQQFGHSSWANFVGCQRADVAAQLARCADASPPRLLKLTRAFLTSDWFEPALQHGWSLSELFGVSPFAPMARHDAWGLVTTLALSKLNGAKLVSLDAGGARIKYASGSHLTWRRGEPSQQTAVEWWTVPALLREMAA